MKKHGITENSAEKQRSEDAASGNETAAAETSVSGKEDKDETAAESEIRDLNEKYLRLYAEFDNYRKRVNKDKEDIQRYGNESLLYELLPVIDNLELALKHGACDPQTGLLQGVEITLKEFRRALEKFGLRRIEAQGRIFDPAVHHAMAQVEREDLDEKMVAEELRPGYLYQEKVLRPTLVSVSTKPRKNQNSAEEHAEPDSANQNIEEEEQ